MAVIEHKTGRYASFSLASLSEVDVIKSDEASYTLQGSEQDLSAVIVDTSNGVLSIKLKDDLKTSNPRVTVQIYTPSVKSIEANAIGMISIPSIINSDQNKLFINAAGSVNIDMQVENINCTIVSSSHVVLKGSARNGNINITAVASLNIRDLKTEAVQMETSAIASITR